MCIIFIIKVKKEAVFVFFVLIFVFLVFLSALGIL